MKRDQHYLDQDRRASLDFGISCGVRCSATGFPVTLISLGLLVWCGMKYFTH